MVECARVSKSPRALQGTVSALHAAAAAAGYEWLSLEHTRLLSNITLGLARQLNEQGLTKPRKPCPLASIADVHALLGAISTDRRFLASELGVARGAQMQALVLFGFLAAFRADTLSRIRFANVRLVGPSLVRIELSGSKTNQFGERVDYMMLPAAPEPGPCCPVFAWREYARRLAALASAARVDLHAPGVPAFPLLSALAQSQARRPMSASNWRKHFTRLAEKIGRHGLTPHSLRVGATTWLHSAGLSPLLVQRHGRWTSHAWSDYVRPTNRPGEATQAASMLVNAISRPTCAPARL